MAKPALTERDEILLRYMEDSHEIPGGFTGDVRDTVRRAYATLLDGGVAHYKALEALSDVIRAVRGMCID